MTATLETLARLLAAGGPAALFLDLAVKGTLVLLVGFIAALCLRRAPAAARHLAWCATFAALLLLPAVALWSPALAVPVLPAAEGDRRRPRDLHPPPVPRRGPPRQALSPSGSPPRPRPPGCPPSPRRRSARRVFSPSSTSWELPASSPTWRSGASGPGPYASARDASTPSPAGGAW